MYPRIYRAIVTALCFFTFLLPTLSWASSAEVSLRVDSEALQKRLAEFIPIDPKSNRIGYLSLGRDRAIDQSTFLYVKLALEEFKKKKVCFVLLDLNTPGGEVLSALNIADLLHQADINDHLPIVAFIDHWALSAGAMLAYSCRFIGIVNTSSMGAAEPVIMGEGGEQKSAPEKITSALRAEFANLASFYGRNPLLAQAMVDKEITLVLREGKIVRLEKEEEIRTTGEHPDLIITKKGKLLTLNAEQLLDFGVADFLVPPAPMIPISKEELATGKWPAEKNLLFQELFFAKIPHATLLSYQDWRVNFFSFLSHPLIASLLFMGLILGAYMEISQPGFGFAGLLALGCLCLILLSSFAIQAVNWIEIILLLGGIALLLIELFLLPSFGIAGILGILLALAGLFSLMLPSLKTISFEMDPETLSLVSKALLEKAAWLCLTLVLSFILIVFLGKYFLRRPSRWNPLVLQGEQEASEGFVAGPLLATLPPLGSKGKTITPFSPSGKIQIEEKIYEAMTEGSFLEKEEPIFVLRYEGSKIIVRSLKNP